MKKILLSLATIGLSLSLVACNKSTSNEANSNTAQKDTANLSIGYQKAALKLIVAKQNKIFEQTFPNTKIEWKEFPAGPQTLEALSVNAIDFGYTGDTPVIFSISSGKPTQYLAYEKASQYAHGLLTPTNSQIKTLLDLKGKRIALTKGSSAHNFLAEVLKKANLTWADIQPVWLTPADARAALERKSIDAWAIWDPYASAAEIQGNAKVLIDSKDLPETYAFYLSSLQFLQAHQQEAKKIIQALNQADDWINTHPDDAAKILAQSTGLDENIAKRVLEKRQKPSPVQPLTSDVVQAQQQVADLFSDLKLIPNTVQLKEHVWQEQIK